MKITKNQLRKIIKEEINKVLSEAKMDGGRTWEMGVGRPPATNDTGEEDVEKPMGTSVSPRLQQVFKLEKLAAEQHMDWALEDDGGMDDVLEVKKLFLAGKATIEELIAALSEYGYNHQ